jgi:hypothetical protein
VTKGYGASVALLLALTAGCSTDEEPRRASDGPTNESTTPAAGGTQTPEPATALLDWQPLTAGLDGHAVSNGTWVASFAEDGSRARLETADGGSESELTASKGFRFSDVVMSEDFAVVAEQDRLEEKSQRLWAIDLADPSARTQVRSPLPASGGTLALHGSLLSYATVDRGAYCLGQHDLATGEHDVAWCAAPRHGFNQVTTTGAGTTLLSFDSGRVSCRTPSVLDQDGTITPVDGIERCKGADSALTDDGAVWSTVPNESRYEQAQFHARAGDATYDLGTGFNGSLTPCGDSLFFIRDAARGEPARLLRWTGTELTVAYESPGTGEAFLEEPACAGTTLTVTAYGEGGDERVSATVPG